MMKIGGTGTELIEIPEGMVDVAPGMVTVMREMVVEEMIIVEERADESAAITVIVTGIGAAPDKTEKYNDKSTIIIIHFEDLK